MRKLHLHSLWSFIKRLFLSILTRESVRVTSFQLGNYPTKKLPFQVNWQVENALFVRLEGYPGFLPLTGQISLATQQDNLRLQLTAYGLGHKTIQWLDIHCAEEIPRMEKGRLPNLFSLNHLPAITKKASFVPEILSPKNNLPRLLPTKAILTAVPLPRSRKIRLQQPIFTVDEADVISFK